MNYVVYADVMLAWLFLINYLTYYITCRILKQRLSHMKLILWNIFSALVLEIFYMKIIYNNQILFKFIYIGINLILMIIFVRFVLNLRTLSSFIRLMTYNILVTLLLAGIIQVFLDGVLKFIIILPVIIIICLIVPLIHKLYPSYMEQQKNIMQVTLSTRSQNIKTVGYMDTGNTLKDIYSGKPVIILDHSLVQSFITKDEYKKIDEYIKTGSYDSIANLNIDGEKVYPIPYKTISNKFSIMPAFKIKCLTLNNNTNYENIVAGISPNSFTKGVEYKVLLNNNL